MKKILFIAITNYNFQKSQLLFHLEKKFLGLSRETKPYVLARGKPFHKRIWGTDFYLLTPGMFFWPLAFFFTFYLCWTKKINTIVSQSPLMEGLLGVILKKIFKTELIVEIHGDWKEGPFLSKKRRLEFLQKKFVPILAKISFKNADKIRGVAKYLIKEAKKTAPDKQYFLFPTFTNLDIFLEEKKTTLDNYILFVGRLSPVKGIDILIKAYSQIHREFPNFKLVLVGEGLEKKNFETSIKNLVALYGREIESKIEFKGRLSLNRVKDAMKNCYVLVLPSLSEGLPMVLMEAMAIGKPIIGSNVGGIPELIRDTQNGFLFEVGDPGKLAEKLRILLNDRNLAVKMGKNGREFIRNNFSNENYINNHLKMINS